jgi:hypothetical protein
VKTGLTYLSDDKSHCLLTQTQAQRETPFAISFAQTKTPSGIPDGVSVYCPNPTPRPA